MEIGAWIPQIFYDIIGRVVPGAVLTSVAVWLFYDDRQLESIATFLFKNSGIPLSLLVLGGLVLFYTVGILLGSIGFLVRFKEWQKWRATELPWIPAELPDERKPRTGISFMYDAVQFHCPAAGARCAKLRAEAHMAWVFVVGLVIIVVLYVPSHLYLVGTLRYWLTIAALLFGCGASYALDRHLSIRCRHLLVNHWRLLDMDGKLKSNAHQAAP
ncbi:MAG: hypothetical protein ABIF82_12400 [Planctomycetota bacterium]